MGGVAVGGMAVSVAVGAAVGGTGVAVAGAGVGVGSLLRQATSRAKVNKTNKREQSLRFIDTYPSKTESVQRTSANSNR